MTTSWKPQGLKMGAVIQGEGTITNIDFHKDGRHLVMSTNESSVHLIDSLTGTERKKIYTKAHGAGKVKFTHHDQSVLVSSDRGKSHDIRYLSMYDNRYERYFTGHTGKVLSLSMHPLEDTFMSTGSDNAMFMWNLGSTTPVAKLQLPPHFEHPIGSFDVSGLIFGVMCYDSRSKNHSIKLYDARSYDQGPFQDIAPKSATIEASMAKLGVQSSSRPWQAQAQWTGFEFSPNGSYILVNTVSDQLFLVDSFNAEADPIVISRKNEAGVNLGACFSSDGQFVAAGNDENEIQIFDASNGSLQATLVGHVAPVGCVRCNPRYDVLAAGCVNTALWISGPE